jgi:hypothetical protein
MPAHRAPPALDTLLAALLAAWAGAGQALLDEARRQVAQRTQWPALRPRPLAPPVAAGGAASDAADGATAFNWADLMPPQALRLEDLRLAFDCALEGGPLGWQLRLLGPPRRFQLPGRRLLRHRLEIRITAAGAGEVRLDGLLWKRFEAAADSGAAA